MHGTRPEHPEVFKARMQHHKDAKKDQGAKVPDKDAAQDKAQTEKRRATFRHKEKAHEQAEQKKPARGVLTHLLPNQ